jgi:hypothetical protein
MAGPPTVRIDSAEMRMLRHIAIAVLMLVPVHVFAGPSLEVRHSGRIQSLLPHEGALTVEEYGGGGAVRLLRVDYRGAVIVWVARDRTHPEQWHERPAQLAELPVGTFVVVHGARRRAGLKASRIEVPR